MLHPEEKQHMRDLMYIDREKEIMYQQEWQEWQKQAVKEKKEAKIVVETIKITEYDTENTKSY